MSLVADSISVATARMRSRKPTDSSRWWRKCWNCFSSRVAEGEEGGGSAWDSPSAIGEESEEEEEQQRVGKSGGRRLRSEARDVGMAVWIGERRERGGWGLGLGFMEREKEKEK